MYIIKVATFFWLIAWICLISRTFLLISRLFFTTGGKVEKSYGGAPPGLRGGVEAGERSATKSRYSAKKTEILRQIHATQPKITSLCVR